MSSDVRIRPIAATDRVSDVLGRDESLVEVFVALGPQFSKLRNSALRRVMARLVTVEQAARMAGVSATILLRDLNAAFGAVAGDPPSRTAVSNGGGNVDNRPGETDARQVHPSDARVVEVDVRDDLRSGREPFSRIMGAVGTLAPREVLLLRTTFEPLPLYTVMAKRHFLHEAQPHARDDWSVWFWRPGGDSDATGAVTTLRGSDAGDAAAATEVPGSPSPNEMWLDVRGLEPPEPLVRTLTALEVLPEGVTLVQINARIPQFLLPMLAERGFSCDIDDSHTDRVLVRMWRAK